MIKFSRYVDVGSVAGELTSPEMFGDKLRERETLFKMVIPSIQHKSELL